MVSPANTNNPSGFLPAPCGLLVDSYCITPLTSQLIHSFCEQVVYLMLLVLTPTTPGPTSVTWHVTVLRNCWIFQDISPRPHSDICMVPEWHCVPGTWRESSAPRLHSIGFQCSTKRYLLSKIDLLFRVLSLLPLFFINMGWQIDLTFGCEVRVVTRYLTFC